MVRSLGHALLHDVSLFERLYTGPDLPGMAKTMLNVQYRFPEALARFPSDEFYQGNLLSSISGAEATNVLQPLLSSHFPWPRVDGQVQPAVFVHCGTEEDHGGMSKSNEGQAALVKHIVKLLSTSSVEGASGEPLAGADLPSITVLTPYTKQTKLLHSMLRAPVQAFTIDSFQGRESDIIGFVEDARRMNVAWTRARRALVVVGDKRTMTGAVGLWQRAVGSCVEVAIQMPEEQTQK
ncbi:AAA domain-containing protein [Amylostereum chailletii]|nr:AAA domain-containing protein [Amylostereum chailletii]